MFNMWRNTQFIQELREAHGEEVAEAYEKMVSHPAYFYACPKCKRLGVLKKAGTKKYKSGQKANIFRCKDEECGGSLTVKNGVLEGGTYTMDDYSRNRLDSF